jgi:hypothetical protein
VLEPSHAELIVSVFTRVHEESVSLGGSMMIVGGAPALSHPPGPSRRLRASRRTPRGPERQADPNEDDDDTSDPWEWWEYEESGPYPWAECSNRMLEVQQACIDECKGQRVPDGYVMVPWTCEAYWNEQGECEVHATCRSMPKMGTGNPLWHGWGGTDILDGTGWGEISGGGGGRDDDDDAPPEADPDPNPEPDPDPGPGDRPYT